MKIIDIELKCLKADEGKVFRRIADGQIYGKEISLGYSYYINGIQLDEPHLDTPEDFEQVDAPVRKTREELEEERRLKRSSAAATMKETINAETVDFVSLGLDSVEPTAAYISACGFMRSSSAE